jgi:LPS export ABC transporter permease LptG/LPS export ABC transporter permease LptF
MPRTLDRYVLREILPPFVLSLLIFTFILTLPPVMRYLEQLVAKGVSFGAAARILATLIPQALGLTIPMATLTGILIALGRLSADREAVALLSLGVSPYRLLRPLMLFATLATGATAYVMFEAIPNANQTFREITWELISKRVEQDIQPRVFFEDFPPYTLYMRDVGPDGTWKDVLVANTSRPEQTQLTLAESGRLVLDREARTVTLVLNNGIQYSVGAKGRTDVYKFGPNFYTSLDANQVFQKQAVSKTTTEMTIAELRQEAQRKLARPEGAHSPHPELIYIQQKFSIPLACLVFAVVALALGLSSAREGKMGAFVIAFAVVFAYYGVMELAAAHTRGYYREIEEAKGLAHANFLFAKMARWWPNIVLGLFGIGALIWRARFSHRGVPVSIPVSVPRLPSGWAASTDPGETPRQAKTGPKRTPRTVVVIRLPRFRMPGPGILDRYTSALYVRIVGLSFLGLLGLFYISTFLDKSEKIFKGSASLGLVMQFLAYSTPQFIYFIIPLAVLLSVLITFGLLARSSELTVMKACGISLYRAALPVVAMSLVGSAILFSLEQRILAESNRKAHAADRIIRDLPPENMNPLNRRWIIGRDGNIYHYGYFDAPRQTLTLLSIFRPAPDGWRLLSHTYANTAEFIDGRWIGKRGSTTDYARPVPDTQTFDSRVLAMQPPEEFGTVTPVAELMTVPELQRHIADLADTGVNVTPLAVELQRKIAFPFVTVVMSLLAVPFGVTTGRRGALYGIGLGIVIALSYWILLHIFLAIGGAGLLPPFLAGWSANIIVAGVAAYLFLNTRT